MVEPDLFTIEPQSLTIGELTAIEELTGLTISETMAAIVDGTAANSAAFMLALQLIAGVRANGGEYTVVDAGAVIYAGLIQGGEADADS